MPKVFITQARQVGKEKKQERQPFAPSAGPAFQLVDGITAPPELADALDTEPRPNADVILVGRAGMPLLASWRFGLGQVIAFSGGVKKDWAGEWATWSQRELLWTQLIQKCLRPPSELLASARVAEADGDLVVALTVIDAE